MIWHIIKGNETNCSKGWINQNSFHYYSAHLIWALKIESNECVHYTNVFEQ